jgi:hypothetical protein
VTGFVKAAGFEKYMATLFPMSGFSTASAPFVSHGRDIMSHTNILWYAATAGWFGFSTPTAHFSHQNGTCKACA